MRLWPRNRVLQVLLILFLLPILAVIIDQLWVAIDRHITISESTTRITSPIDHGYPDYLAAINAAHADGVTPDNNAAIPIGEITGTGEMPAAQVQEVFRILGATPPASPLFITYKQWAASRAVRVPPVGNDPFMFDGFTIPAGEGDILYSAEEQARTAPWSAAAHPVLTLRLSDLAPTLTKFEEAGKKSRYYYPLVTADGRSSGAAQFAVLGAGLPSLGVHRDLTNTLMARAMQRLGTGDAQGFSRDILTSTRHARLLAQQPTLIEYLVATGIDAMVQKVIQIAATSDRLPPTDAAALYQELDRLGPLPPPSHSIDESERFMLLDTICSTNARNGSGNLPTAFNTFGRVIPTNYNHALRQANRFYDRYKDAFDNPDYASAKTDVDAIEHEIITLGSRSILSKMAHTEDLFVSIFIPSLSNVLRITTADRQERDLSLIALQLRAARANNQPFPASLAALQNIPNDRFTNQPLVYKRQANGYLLYSVGPNLKDDGGIREKRTDRGDLSVQANQ